MYVLVPVCFGCSAAGAVLLLRLEFFKNSLDLHLLASSADDDRYCVANLALADQ